MFDTAISYISIDDTAGDYFWTQRQIQKLNAPYVDSFPGTLISGLNSTVAVLSRPPTRSIAPAAKQRDYLASGTLDLRRTGSEILNSKQFIAGTCTISAGTPGHIVDPVCYGVDTISSVDPDVYYEIPVFNPVDFLLTNAEGYTYPIVTADTNTSVNYSLNGTIEPLTIRSVASFFSVDVPREAHSAKATYGNGNEDIFGRCDQVLTVDYQDQRSQNFNPFLESAASIGMMTDGVFIGVEIPYFQMPSKRLQPFVESHKLRGLTPSESYDEQLISALSAMNYNQSNHGNYIAENQRSATTGFMYDNANPQGTDSIAFGGMLY